MGNPALPELKFYYKNYRGVHSMRTVQDPKWRFGSTEYHTKEQWLIDAFDVEKKDFRTFAAADIVQIF